MMDGDGREASRDRVGSETKEPPGNGRIHMKGPDRDIHTKLSYEARLIAKATLHSHLLTLRLTFTRSAICRLEASHRVKNNFIMQH